MSSTHIKILNEQMVFFQVRKYYISLDILIARQKIAMMYINKQNTNMYAHSWRRYFISQYRFTFYYTYTHSLSLNMLAV